MMSVEQHLDNVFSEGAKLKEEKMKGKIYTYKLYNGSFMDNLAQSGQCIVLSREYDRDLDCDVITVEDCDTKEKFAADQFALHLVERV